MPSFGGDRTTQIVWVQKIINPEFGQGDFLLSSGYPLRNFFAIIIAIVAKFSSLNIAYFILTLAMSFLTMISFVIFFKKLNLLNFNESLVIAFAMSTLTFGRLGYSLGSGDTEHFNLLPRGVAFSLGIIGLAYLVAREKRPLLGSLYLLLSFLVQPLVVLYFLVILIILYLVLQLSEILKYKKLNLSHKNSILPNIILTVSYIIFFVVFQNNLSNFSLLLSLWFINFVIIINLIKFYIVLKESTFTYTFGIKIFTSLLLIFLLILFLLNYNFRSSTQFTFKYDSFLQSLRAYDLILTYFRNPLRADLENSSDKTIFFLGIFLLLIFLLFLKFSNLVGITPILVTFTILNIHFFMIILTDFFVKHSSLGGFQVLWPLSHTGIIYISIIFITVYFCKHFFRSNFLLLPTILGLSLLEFLYKEFSIEKEAFGQLVVLLLLLTLFASKGAGSRENQNAQN
jgi:hypothetical protein